MENGFWKHFFQAIVATFIHLWSWSCSPYRSTRVHTRFLARFMCQSLVFSVVCCTSLFSLFVFLFCHWIVCPSLICNFWLPFWFLHKKKLRQDGRSIWTCTQSDHKRSSLYFDFFFHGGIKEQQNKKAVMYINNKVNVAPMNIEQRFDEHHW